MMSTEAMDQSTSSAGNTSSVSSPDKSRDYSSLYAMSSQPDSNSAILSDTGNTIEFGTFHEIIQLVEAYL